MTQSDDRRLAQVIEFDRWHIENTDCIKHMAQLPDNVFDLSIFSPPFPSLYAYTNEPGDVGNSEGLKREGKLHLSFFYKQLARVIKPGRAICVHVMQIPRLKRSGEVGLHDFRGLNIRIGERAGLVYEYDWAIRKNPQAQAIRTRSRELQFNGLESDRAKQRGTLLDYIIKFRVPGDNKTPINQPNQVSRNQWIKWAEGCWQDIKETDTLNTKEAKSEDDTKHICPLQLGLIRRLIHLFSDPDEIVFSPFTGIGSEGYEAIKSDRRFYGCELKPEYFETAKRNMAKAESATRENLALFSLEAG
jgi:DNA modification methylase